MTSVAPEASAVSHRSARTERSSRPSGMREDSGFAALVDEARPEPRPSANQTQPRDRVKRAEKPDAASSKAPVADEPTPASDNATTAEATTEVTPESNGDAPSHESMVVITPSEGVTDEMLTAAIDAIATEGENTDAPVDTSVAAPVPTQITANTPPAGQLSVAAVITPAAEPAAQTAPETASPDITANPAQSMPAAPAVAPGTTMPVADSPGTQAAAAAAQPVPAAGAAQQSGDAAPVIDQPAAIGDATGEAQAQLTKTTAPQIATQDTTDAETDAAAGAPDQPEQSRTPTEPAPSRTAPVRPDAAADKPDLRPDAVFTSDDPALPTKPAIEPTAQAAQLASPAPVHAATTQATTQAAPVSAAQPVPVDAIAVEIASQARAGNSRFDIRLDPPELGRIDVRLDVDRDGNVKSRLVIERSDTYDLLRRDQSTLERALQQAGLKTSDNALEFSLRDQGFAQQRDADDQPRGTRAMIQDAEVSPNEAASGYARLLGARGGIDIRV